MPPGTIHEQREAERTARLQALANKRQPLGKVVSSVSPGRVRAAPGDRATRPGPSASQGPSAPGHRGALAVAAAAAATVVTSADATRQEALLQNARLEGANRQLRERLQEALQELDASHAQLRILHSLQQQLEDATPGAAELAAAALEQERALQAARDAQVLQLLRSKDEVIESFEARYAESRAEAAQYREQLEAAQQQLDNSQLRVRELVEFKRQLRQQAEQQVAAAGDIEVVLRQDVVRLQGEAAKCDQLRQQAQLLEQQLADARGELDGAHRQMQMLSDTVDAANDAIMEVQGMLTEREQQVAAKDAEVQAMQQHMGQLLGMPTADVPLLHRARFAVQDGSPQVPDQAVPSRMVALEAANERLELALVEAMRSAAAAGGLPAQPSAADSEQDAVGELIAQLAVVTGQQRAAEERVQQLEKLLKVAEATVLHNEVQLQDTLEGRMLAEEQVHSLRLELEDGQALLAQLKSTLSQLAAAEQAAQEEAAAVRSTLQTADQKDQQQDGQARQPADDTDTVPEAATRAAAAPTSTGSHRPGGQGEEVGTAVGDLVQQIHSLGQQVSQQQQQLEEAAAAAAQQQQLAVAHTVGVQCEPPVQSSAAVQAVPFGDVTESGVQTEDVQQLAAESIPESGDPPLGRADAGYGRADTQQQQVADLTAQLAAARLAEVAAKAEHATTDARLLEAERKLDVQQAALLAKELELADAGELRAAAMHGANSAGSAAEQLRTECSQLQAEVDRLDACLAAAQREAQAELALAVGRAQAEQKALQAQLSALEGSKCELSELRSSAYAAVHRVRQALREHGGEPVALPDGCEPGSVPQQLKQAVDMLLAMLQEHGELVAAFQQHIQQQQPGLTPAAAHSAGVDMPVEASQRAVIRSLAAQVADLQRRLEQAGVERQHLQERLRMLRSALAAPGQAGAAAGVVSEVGESAARGWEEGPAAWQQQAEPAVPVGTQADVAQLVGMFVLLKQQLAGLERIQQQLEAGQLGSSSTADGPAAAATIGSSASGSGGAVPYLPSLAHTAALLGTELPALRATVGVMEAEVRRMAAEAAAESVPRADHPGPAAGTVLCLPAPGIAPDAASSPAAAAANIAQRKGKWKARCKELQAQLAAATSAAQQGEAALQAQLAEAERASAQQATQQAATVQALQERVEELATAGSQLESALQDNTIQLTEAAGAAEALQQQLHRQQQQHKEAMRDAATRLAAAEAELEQEQKRHASLVASMQEVMGSLQSSGDAEGRLRSQLVELAERVAVLTAGQEGAKAEAEHKQQLLTTLQQELEAAHAAYDELAEGKQQREAELVGRLEALQRECGTLLAVVERAEAQHGEVERRLQAQLTLLGSQLQQQGDEEAAHLPALTAALDRLQDSAEAWEVRLLRLEAQAAVAMQDRQAAAVGQWATVVRSRRYRSAVKQLRDGLQAQLLDAQAACQQQAAHLRQLQAALEAARGECAALTAQLQDGTLQHQQEQQQAAERWQQELAAVQQQAEEQRQELQQAAGAAAAGAAVEVEQRCRVEMAARVRQTEQRALHDLEVAEQQCSGLQAELEAVRSEFQRYQGMKAVEVRLLEQRVMQHLRSSSSGGGGGSSNALGGKQGGRAGASGANAAAAAAAGGGGIPAVRPAGSSGSCDGKLVTVAELQAVCCQEGIAAALREASLERLQREQLEEQLAAAKEAGEQLGSRARAAEQELAASKSRHAGEARSVRERAERLAAELDDCQQALRVAKAEGSRRLKELQALQRQAAANENGGGNGTAAAARLESEAQAREAAEAQLHEARQSLTRKAALIRDLRAKIGELEQELAARDPTPLLSELESCQSRLRQVQAACGSKETSIRELRERLEQQTRLAHQQGRLEEREQQEAGLARLSRDLADRDAQVAHLHGQLQQVHQELAATSAGLQAAAASQSEAAGGAATRLAQAGQCAQQLVQAVKLLLDTLSQLGAAVAAEAAQAAWRQGGSQAEAAAISAAAGDIASFVDLPADDICSMLLPASAQQPATAAAASSMEAAAQQAWDVLQQLDAQLGAGSWQGQACGSLVAAVSQLQEESTRFQAALAAVHGSSSSMQPCGELAFEDLEQRLQAAAAEVADLEARIR